MTVAIKENKVLIKTRASEVPSASWVSKVYKPAEKFESRPEWEGIVKVVKARDKHSCKSCGIKVGLTVHHILPRSEGGTDYPPNLITLCGFCHDEIEELGFKVKEQIIDYKRTRKYIKHSPREATKEKAVRWQQWVYGGYKNPNKE